MDTNENPEPTPAEKTLLEAATVLDNAGVPRTDTERDGVGINLELNLAGRILWLVEQRTDLESALRVARADRTISITEVQAAQTRANEAEANLSELHTNLRQALGDLSQCYNRAADELQALAEQRDKAAATTLSAADDAGQLATENLRLERLVRQLTAKVKRLESAGSGARFALTSEPHRAQLRADIVVDAKSGRVLKNRFGKASPGAVLPVKTKKLTRKPATRKRA